MINIVKGNKSVCSVQLSKKSVLKKPCNIIYFILQPQSGISNTSGSFVDGVFECGFVRQKYVENTEEVFDLEKPWNILFASGRSKSGTSIN